MTSKFTFGLTTFGDMGSSPNAAPDEYRESIANIVTEASLADRLDVDFFGVGEHHRADFSVSAPEIILASIAARTERLRIGTAATVFPTDDPVRLFQRFATLDAVSNGRAELILGRGWFNEAFELFGFNPADNSHLFEQKVSVFRHLVLHGTVARSRDRSAGVSGLAVYPKMKGDLGRIWLAVGSTPESALRAARFGYPMMLAVIGGPPARFRPLIDIYRLACEKLDRAPMQVGIHSSGYVAETDDQAKREFWPYYEDQRNSLGANRGWPPLTEKQFDNEVALGSLFVGSPGTIAKKIANTLCVLDCKRINIKYSCGSMPHSQLLKSINLFGSEVFPIVRRLMAV